MKKIIATAYDVNPFKGSESGTGWNFAVQLARYNTVTLVTRKNNRGEIERFIFENGPIRNLKFEYFDFNSRITWLKKRFKIHFIYFNFWQLGVALSYFKKRKEFDICHCINFHADHVPQFLWILGLPVVWGPLNHNELTPRLAFNNYRMFLTKSYLLFIIKYIRWNFDPFVRLSVAKSTFIIGSTQAVQMRLAVSTDKFILLSTIGCEDDKERIRRTKPEIVKFLVIGRLVSIKAVYLAISAFNQAKEYLGENASLIIVGDGPKRKELELQVSKLGLDDYVEFKGSIPRKDVLKEFMDATALLFTSFEGGGAVVGESLSKGIPVIINKSAGASSIFKENYRLFIGNSSEKKDFISSCSKALIYCANLPSKEYSKLSDEMLLIFRSEINWNSKGEKLNQIYKQL
jgi:glycosyltransferase involved in cell wall biosynthesis